MCHELPVIEKGKSGKGRRGILRILPGLDMYGSEHCVPGLCHLLQYRYILCRKRALICVIQHKSLRHIFIPVHAAPEVGKGCALLKWQIHQLKIRLCRIRSLKALIAHIFRVREESHFLFGGQDHKPLFPFRFTVPDTCIQQKVRVSMPLELPGYPQAVNVHIALRLHGRPCVFCRDIFNEAFSTDIAF